MKTKIFLGEFDVVEVKLGSPVVNIGRNVHITIHMGDFQANVKVGDKLPLFTEVERAKPERSAS